MTNHFYDSRGYWHHKAKTRQKLLERTQQDYDVVESELRALLTPVVGVDPNPSLLALNHNDLAMLADQYRVRLLKGPHTMPLTDASGLEEEPLPTTSVDNE